MAIYIDENVGFWFFGKKEETLEEKIERAKKYLNELSFRSDLYKALLIDFKKNFGKEPSEQTKAIFKNAIEVFNNIKKEIEKSIRDNIGITDKDAKEYDKEVKKWEKRMDEAMNADVKMSLIEGIRKAFGRAVSKITSPFSGLLSLFSSIPGVVKIGLFALTGIAIFTAFNLAKRAPKYFLPYEEGKK